MDNEVDIVYATQDCSFPPEIPDKTPSTHPQKLSCRRTQLPKPPQGIHMPQNSPFLPYISSHGPMLVPLVHGQNTFQAMSMEQKQMHMYQPNAMNYSQDSLLNQTQTTSPPIVMNQSKDVLESKVKVKPAKRQRSEAKNSKNTSKKCKVEKEDGSVKYARWEDKWCVSLIHVRGEMQDEFSKPPKQGINLWNTVLTKLVGLCPDFDKDAESCRKKWNALYKEYMAIKAHNNISGNERAEESQWYSLIDDYMGHRANVTKAVHGGAISTNCSEDVKEENPPASKKNARDKKSPLLEEMKEGREKLLEKMTQWEERRLEILSDLRTSFAELVKKF